MTAATVKSALFISQVHTLDCWGLTQLSKPPGFARGALGATIPNAPGTSSRHTAVPNHKVWQSPSTLGPEGGGVWPRVVGVPGNRVS